MACTAAPSSAFVHVTNTFPAGLQEVTPLTGWITALGVDALRYIMRRLADRLDPLDLQLCIQTTTGFVDESGAFGRDDWQSLGGVFAGAAGDGASPQTTSIAGLLAGKSMFRLGIMHERAGSIGAGAAEIALDAQYSQCGKQIGSVEGGKVQVHKQGLHMPMSEWLPAQDLAETLVAVRLDAPSSVTAQLYIETYDDDRTEPNQPVLLGSAITGGSSANTGAVNVTAHTDPPVGTKPWRARFGLYLEQAGGAANDEEEATIYALLQGRYS